jgi:regulator of nonsense transcripts 1
MKMTMSKTFSSFRSSSHRHRFHDDEKKFNNKRELNSFFKRIDKRNIETSSSSLHVNGFNDNREGFSNEKYSEDVERKYNFYDNTYNKNDDYETKNKRNDFYRMKPSDDDFDENNTNNNDNNNNKNIRPAKEKKRKTVADLMTNRRRLSSSSSSSSSSQKTMGSSSSSKRGTTAARKIEGLVDAKAIQEREKMWARAAKGSGKKSAEDKYGYLFGDGTKRQTTTRRSGGEKDLQHEEKKKTRSRGQSREDIRGAYKAHKERYSKAITCEFEEEREQFKERLESWPLSRLKNEGYCLSDVRARYEGTIGRDALVRVLRPRRDLPKNTPLGEELPFHRISVGDMVILSDNEVERVTLEDINVYGSEEGTSSSSSIVGIVASRQMFYLTIAIPEDDLGDVLRDGENGRRLRIDLSANTVAYDRAISALEAFSEPGGMPGLERSKMNDSSGGNKKSGGDSNKLSQTAYQTFQRSLLGFVSSSSVNSLASTPISWKNDQRIDQAMSSYAKNLNPSQRKAVKAAMQNTLTLWRGPPGTGKTRTLVALIASVVNYANVQENGGKSDRGKSSNTQASWRGPKVLACAASNVAVDNILDALLREKIDRSMNILRLGSPARVQPWLLESTLSHKVALHPKGKEANSIRERFRGITSLEAAKARKQAQQLDREAAIQVVNASDVILATCVGAGDDLLADRVFRYAFVDEAAQCVEPHTLIPLTKALAGVLVGDTKQLPPTVVSRDAVAIGLQRSLIERLELLGVEPYLLEEQYRMHPGLAAFSSVRFYDRRLKSVPKPSERVAPNGVNWPSTMVPLAFVEVKGEEMRAPDGNSIFNVQEAEECVRVVQKLLLSGDVKNAGDIGIIAPYAAQVRAISEEWNRKVTSDVKLKNTSIVEADNPESAKDELEIRSVDGFQGREKEVIVLCTVRNNRQNQLGFVADPRRLNVAITRAKRGLIVLGHRDTLSTDQLWHKWLQFVDKYECEVESADVFLDES